MSHRDNRTGPPSWATVLAVVIAVAVSYVGFARVSVETTLLVASTIFVGLIVFLWRAGVRKKRDGGTRR